MLLFGHRLLSMPPSKSHHRNSMLQNCWLESGLICWTLWLFPIALHRWRKVNVPLKLSTSKISQKTLKPHTETTWVRQTMPQSPPASVWAAPLREGAQAQTGLSLQSIITKLLFKHQYFPLESLREAIVQEKRAGEQIWLAGCSGTHPGRCKISPRMETPQPLQVLQFECLTTLTAKKMCFFAQENDAEGRNLAQWISWGCKLLFYDRILWNSAKNDLCRAPEWPCRNTQSALLSCRGF